ncbi:uncharacterized protein DUF1648 [Saccharopolyspora erythraea NRRL 2338]|nr:DUF1648 domain-containing protein [Saccharopolyspora erythraea]PFG98941.1 uncharacterized protein DUF1648 [Saccharopolyspora erythraea NRRL 2338]
MTFRAMFALGGVVWAALVTGALLAGVLLLGGRLPDPMATHWGPSGVPDGSMTRTGFLAFVVGLWVVIAVGTLVFAVRGGLGRRASRVLLCGTLAGGGLFVLGLLGLTVWANEGAAHWQQARSLSWQAFLAVGGAVLVGALAGWLANRGPDDTPPPVAGESRMRIEAGQRVVWMATMSSSLLRGLGLAILVPAVVLTAVPLFAEAPPLWPVALVFGVCSLLVLALSSILVHVGESGVRIAFGPLRWPVRKLPLERITGAEAADKRAVEVGGWGYRVLPGQTAVMMRGGECLVLHLESGRRFVISVDGAERGAELLNALVAERSAVDGR